MEIKKQKILYIVIPAAWYQFILKYIYIYWSQTKKYFFIKQEEYNSCYSSQIPTNY